MKENHEGKSTLTATCNVHLSVFVLALVYGPSEESAGGNKVETEATRKQLDDTQIISKEFRTKVGST